MVIFLLPWQPNNGTLNNLPKNMTFSRQNTSLQQTNISKQASKFISKSAKYNAFGCTIHINSNMT